MQWLRVSPWWQKVLVILPLVLIPLGGLLGALAGAGAAAANQAILRSGLPTGAKVVICIAIFFAAAILWLVAAALLFIALHPQG
jgi:hypothetical protein